MAEAAVKKAAGGGEVGIPNQVGRTSHHPSALRNRDPILAELQKRVPVDASGPALELASGTGAHVEVFAPAFPGLKWHPSEYIPSEDVAAGILGTIDKHGADLHPANVERAVGIDASLEFAAWPEAVRAQAGTFAVAYIGNVFHITPITVMQGVLRGAGAALVAGGSLFVYGPFKLDGKFTSEGNEKFDANLRAQDPSWGYRDVEEVRTEADKHGLDLLERVDMPANNFLLHLKKKGGAEGKM